MTVDDVIAKYQSVGIEKGSAFLLPPKLAVSFIEDLSTHNIFMLGVTSWTYVNLNDGGKGIAQDLANDYSIDEEIVESNNVAQSAEQCISFVQQVSGIVDLVSIDTWVVPK